MKCFNIWFEFFVVFLRCLEKLLNRVLLFHMCKEAVDFWLSVVDLQLNMFFAEWTLYQTDVAGYVTVELHFLLAKVDSLVVCQYAQNRICMLHYHFTDHDSLFRVFDRWLLTLLVCLTLFLWFAYVCLTLFLWFTIVCLTFLHCQVLERTPCFDYLIVITENKNNWDFLLRLLMYQMIQDDKYSLNWVSSLRHIFLDVTWEFFEQSHFGTLPFIVGQSLRLVA